MNDFKKIKLLILDNDGVLTDGRIIYDDNQLEAKNFSAKDGLGIRLLQQTDIQVAVVTGRTSRILEKRCRDLNIDLLFQHVRNKYKKIEELLADLNLNWANVAYLGDDWNDYPAMKRCGISAVPADAFPDLMKTANVILTRKGGKGAVREFIEMILKEKGVFEETLEKLLMKLETIDQ